jgi:formylmethanofuran--tetrahydromethanopterin N-formyltransferase
VNCVYEIVIDGTSSVDIERAMWNGMDAGAGDGVVAISAGNYGGKLGKHHFHLHEIVRQFNT